MPVLTLIRGAQRAEIVFSGTPTLSQALAATPFALPQPCGGRGVCGKCAVIALTGAVSAPNEAERNLGARLACQARLLGPCTAELPAAQHWAAIETSHHTAARGLPMPGRYGAAVDLGTTTLVARVYDLASGKMLAEQAALNPQTTVAADVMGRISSALAGQLGALRAMAEKAVLQAVAGACALADVPGVDAMVVAGNTTMLYLLTGRTPETLARAPFTADDLFGREVTLGGVNTYLPPCTGAFMGADLTCAALSTGLTGAPDTVLLMDIGTNGELMLWHQDTLYAASTAAGPAFEGGEISRGLGGVTGAIDKVWAENGQLGARVLGGGHAEGICGSGLIDAVAVLLQLGCVDETGASDAPAFVLRDDVTLTAGDIRAVQLAKAAIAAGVETLLASAGIRAPQVHRLLLAGGFGSHLSVTSAAAIGLIPATLAAKAQAVGNASLAGASMLLLDTRARAQAEHIAGKARLVPLGGDPGFAERFMAALSFPAGMDEE